LAKPPSFTYLLVLLLVGVIAGLGAAIIVLLFSLVAGGGFALDIVLIAQAAWADRSAR